MLFYVCGLIVGIMILCGGLYYLIKEKEDSESAKIYGIVAGVGLVITVFILVKWFVL